jgi:hypothetical protein
MLENQGEQRRAPCDRVVSAKPTFASIPFRRPLLKSEGISRGGDLKKMSGQSIRAERYRAMAGEIRAVAKTLTFDEARTALQVLADSYERMAEHDLEDRPLGKSHRS